MQSWLSVCKIAPTIPICTGRNLYYKQNAKYIQTCKPTQKGRINPEQWTSGLNTINSSHLYHRTVKDASAYIQTRSIRTQVEKKLVRVCTKLRILHAS